MLDMAKPPKKTKGDKSPDGHKHPLISLRPTRELRDAVAAFAAEHRWSVSQAAAVLIEQALEALGRWPPPALSEED